MILPLKRYFDFKGRSRRQEYWMFVLFAILVGFAAGLVDLALGFGTSEVSTSATGASAAFRSNGPVNAIVSLALIIPQIAVGVRRLHDIDRTGWWMLLVFVIFIGWIVLFVFFVTDGTRGSNRFGPDPKDPYGDDDAVFG